MVRRRFAPERPMSVIESRRERTSMLVRRSEANRATPVRVRFACLESPTVAGVFTFQELAGRGRALAQWRGRVGRPGASQSTCGLVSTAHYAAGHSDHVSLRVEVAERGRMCPCRRSRSALLLCGFTHIFSAQLHLSAVTGLWIQFT